MPQRLQGIDIAVYQPIPNVTKLISSGLAFCYVKASEGNTVQSTSFDAQYKNIGLSSLLRGAYHFFIPGDDGVTQAKNFAGKAKAAFATGDLPPMIDVEAALNGTTAATAIQNLKNCIAQVVNDFGVQPLIYTNCPYWKDVLGNPTGFSASPLWIAAYTSVQPTVVGDWAAMTLWQFTESYAATVFDQAANTDSDYYFGSITDLWNLAGISSIGPSSTYQSKAFALQTQLTNAGYNTGGADGMFGPNTSAALANWQNANGFPTGPITPDQWMKLFNIKYV